jgi:hypothetical protein
VAKATPLSRSGSERARRANLREALFRIPDPESPIPALENPESRIPNPGFPPFAALQQRGA